jgi:magnesium-transporting ATPase (P-type)
VPVSFPHILTSYTQAGYRVIALAKKSLSDMDYHEMRTLSRETLEQNLEIVGLLVMENRLKPETTRVIGTLQEADIRTIMCTGDNLLTALSVARDCNMVIDGEKVVIIEAEAGVEPKFLSAQPARRIEMESETSVSPKSKRTQV